MCMSHVCRCLQSQEGVMDPLELYLEVVTGAAWCGYWELISDPLEDQLVLLCAEPLSQTKEAPLPVQVLVIHGYAFSWKSVRCRNVLMAGTEPYSSLCSMVSLFQIFSMLRGPRRVSQCYYCITVVYTVSTKAILIIQDSSFCYPRPRQNIVSGNMAVLGEHLGRNNGDIGLACSGQEMEWFIPSNGPFCILEAEM